MSTFEKPQSWHDMRANGIGASEVAAILGISPYTTAHQLWLEKTKKVERKDISHLPHVAKGILGEQICRDLYERQTLRSYTPKNWAGLSPWHRASDDGWNIDTNTILEIKCQSALNHEMTKAGTVPEYYACQVQWQLYVSKAEKCYFISFRIENEEMAIVEVLPDPEEQKKILEAVDYFWLTNVLKDIPPERTDKDYLLVGNKELDEKLKQYEEAQKQIKVLEEQAKALKEDIRPHLYRHTAIKTPAGFKLSVTERQGTLDYAKFITDKGISEEELKAYRKKPIKVFTIRLPD